MTIRSAFATAFTVIMLATVTPASVKTQSGTDQTAKPAQLPPAPAVTLMITVSISRWEAEKKSARRPSS